MLRKCPFEAPGEERSIMTASPKPHESHPDIVKRLKRAEGHLRSIITMIEEGRACLDITQQLHAVEHAVSQAKRILVHDHIDHCLENGTKTEAHERRKSIEEFKLITKYL
jgi:DNA-binding FrmR family transcriptional regulator